MSTPQEFFSDKQAVNASEHPEIHTVSLLFGLEGEPGYRQRVYMTDETAKKLAIILARTIKTRESALGHAIMLDEGFYRRVGAAPEDF